MSQEFPNPSQQPYNQPGFTSPPSYMPPSQPMQQGYAQSAQQPMMPPPQFAPPKKKRSMTWLWILAIIVAFFVGFGAGHAGGGSAPATTTTATSQSSTSTQPGATTQPTTAPASSAKWTTTHSYSGNGTKKTEIITVPDDWKIVWSCKSTDIGGTAVDGAFTVAVTNSATNVPVDVAVNATCKAGKTTSDTTEEHQGGSVYLDINATGDWTVKIQELK